MAGKELLFERWQVPKERRRRRWQELWSLMLVLEQLAVIAVADQVQEPRLELRLEVLQ